MKCVSAFICAAEKPSRTQVSDEISQHLQFPLMGGHSGGGTCCGESFSRSLVTFQC